MQAILLAYAWSRGAPSPVRYSGRRFGVSANVDLDMFSKIATVTLSGIPIGGSINGTATLDESGNPVLDDKLRDALARRGVSVDTVDMDSGSTSCRVVARLPFARCLSITLNKLDV